MDRTASNEEDTKAEGHSQRMEASRETFSRRPARRTEPGHEHSTCASGSQNERGYDGDLAATSIARRRPETDERERSMHDRGTDNSMAERSRKARSPTMFTRYKQVSAYPRRTERLLESRTGTISKDSIS
jgi:hypothetical protein